VGTHRLLDHGLAIGGGRIRGVGPAHHLRRQADRDGGAARGQSGALEERAAVDGSAEEPG